MGIVMLRRALVPVMLLAAGCQRVPTTVVDPLPSWNDTAPKQAIVEFVTRVTTSGGAGSASIMYRCSGRSLKSRTPVTGWPSRRIAAIARSGPS